MKKMPRWFLEDGISGKQYSITSRALSNSPPGILASAIFRAIKEKQLL